MLRQVTTRNQRAKGFTVKSVVQVCLLVLVCAWILYQIKHSYDERKPDQETPAVKKLHGKETTAQEFKHKHGQKGDRKTGRTRDPRVVDNQQYEDASREARESSFAGDDASSEVVQTAAPSKAEDSEGYNSSAAKPVDVTEAEVTRNESDAHMALDSKDLMIHSTAANLASVSRSKSDDAQVSLTQVNKDASFKHQNTTDEKTDGTSAKVIVEGKNDI